ncbi:MAG: bifunctional folylpolyglutamate synthase/dihydrofolate synthase [Candidatus Melainabacteria bacterium]|nr:bifunctional folylpolyglutamate synthase/dihydrofolate synthase [Candidatus Melainabacteria bacterium]
MNYTDLLLYIESLSPTTQKPCLERMKLFMEESGKLQDSFSSIHVGGTNGKGSTAVMLASVCRQVGLKVGCFTGPHLLRWNERFHVDGQPVADEELSYLATYVRALSEGFGQKHPEFGTLTWFEFLTAVAFFLFAQRKVDVAVVEVGLGGRWDATNVLSSPLATAITNVELDHMQILGETIAEIAYEKSGIIKPGVPIVTASSGCALDVVRETATALGAPLIECRLPDMILSRNLNWKLAQAFSQHDFAYIVERLSLRGRHQKLNALVAIGTLIASGLVNCQAHNLRDLLVPALSSVYWPGRLQFLWDYQLVVDGAHNPHGARALRQALDELFPGKDIIFVLGCFQNKDVGRVVSELIRTGDRVFACETESRRAVFPAQRIVEVAQDRGAAGQSFPTVGHALLAALSCRASHEIIVATGSFAIVKDVMAHLGWSCVEDGVKPPPLMPGCPCMKVSLES